MNSQAAFVGRYRVTWPILSTLPVKNRVPRYSAIGVTIRYGRDERDQTLLKGVEHEFSWQRPERLQTLESELILRESSLILTPFWHYLEYLSVVPLERGNPSVVAVPPTPRVSVGVMLPLRTALLRDVPMPKPGFFGSPKEPRLFDWLRLASEAESSTGDATAVRLYYIVLEDVGRASRDLKIARHLVSHAKVTPGSGAANHLKRALGKEVPRYDPFDADQARYLARVRGEAKKVVESLLREYLPAYRL